MFLVAYPTSSVPSIARRSSRLRYTRPYASTRFQVRSFPLSHLTDSSVRSPIGEHGVVPRQAPTLRRRRISDNSLSRVTCHVSRLTDPCVRRQAPCPAWAPPTQSLSLPPPCPGARIPTPFRPSNASSIPRHSASSTSCSHRPCVWFYHVCEPETHFGAFARQTPRRTGITQRLHTVLSSVIHWIFASLNTESNSKGYR